MPAECSPPTSVYDQETRQADFHDHALLAEDGLPIYDSRVAFAIAMLAEHYGRERGLPALPESALANGDYDDADVEARAKLAAIVVHAGDKVAQTGKRPLPV